jgi:ATP-binding cassette subfamily B protein/subfamily B ATP-binding cassette protein MsbA
MGLSLLEVGLLALSPWPLQVIVDYVLGGQPLPDVLARITPAAVAGSATALLIVVAAVGLLIQIGNEVVRMVHTQMQVEVAQDVVYTLRSRVLEHLQALPLRHHLTTPTADSVYRLDADAHCVDDLILGGVFPLVVAGLKLVVMFSVLVYVDVTLALLSLGVAPFLFLCLRYYSRRMVDRAERVKGLESRVIERAFETLSLVAAVKSFARERFELARFQRAGDESVRARLGLTWQESLFSVTVTGITLVGTAAVLVLGGLHVLAGTLSLGTLLVVIAYLAAVYDPLSAIAHSTGSLQQAVASARRVRSIFALAPEVLDDPDGLDASGIAGHVRFEDVSFAYEGASEVLHGIDFDVRPGELVALVGPTGAGKTTLASLVPRFFEPTSGRVLVDSVDASRYSLTSLRERIALVPQFPVLFTGTIGDNIRYGRLEASDSDVEAAARAAQAHAFIARLPQGYETPIGESGATLSGGERQRIGIARALLKRAPVIILDEPTSAIDAISEGAIFDALRRLRPDHSMLVIAHRLSTVRDATRILVLDGGRIVEQGTHDELIDSCDLYRRMCQRLSLAPSGSEEGVPGTAVRAVS